MSRDPFELVVGHQALPVASLRARERINGLTRVDLRLDSARAAALSLGAQASVVIHGSPFGPRYFHGVLTRIARGASSANVRLEPRLSRLERRRLHRIFHDSSQLEVVTTILAEQGIPLRLRLTRQYPKHPHLVQRGESDLTFFRRLLSAAGIFYFFDHANQAGEDVDATNMGGGEVLVLADSAAAYSVLLGGPMHHRTSAAGGTRDDQALRSLEDRKVASVERVMTVGRTFVTPSTAVLTDSAVAGLVTGDSVPLPRYERRGVAYEHSFDLDDEPSAPVRSRDRLDAERSRSETFRSESTSPHLMPGRRFVLEFSLLEDTPEELVVVETRHDGDALRTPDSYRAVSVHTSARVAHRMRAPRPRAAPIETATVVGPPGTELHTDSHGRIQVRFHWDLDREPPVAWVRVAQSWSGAGFGANFLPRVGAEVIIGYVGGDPDRPVVLGTLHNALLPPAFAHGADADRSGIRTRSTPGGAGYHELVFEDRQGHERIGLRSQRDLSIEALGDTLVELRGQRTEMIGGAASTTVAGASTSLVGGARVEQTALSRTVRVGGADRIEVSGDAVDIVGGSEAHHVLGSSSTTKVAGSRFTFVGVGPTGGSDLLSSTGSIQQSAGRSIELEAVDGIHLRCGDSSIRMTPDGIFLESARVETCATESSRVLHGEKRKQVWSSDGGFTVSADVIKLATAGASLVLDAEAKLDGALVKLNCGASSAGGSGQGLVNESGEAAFRLDPGGVPVGSGPYTFVILAPNGEVLSRELMPGGQVRLQGKPGERFVLDAVRLGKRMLPFKRSSE